MNTYQNWYDTFYQRVAVWTGDCSVGAADVILQVPDLLKLVIHLSQDPRTPTNSQAALAHSAQRVLAGLDFLPANDTAIIPLLGDALHLAQTLQDHYPQLSPAAIADHWTGDLAQTLHYLLHQREAYAPRC